MNVVQEISCADLEELHRFPEAAEAPRPEALEIDPVRDGSAEGVARGRRDHDLPAVGRCADACDGVDREAAGIRP